jgi:hypothetical protein
MIEILWSEDISFGIYGDSTIVRESMNCHEETSVVKISIKSVKLDTSPVVKLISGPKIIFRSKKAEEFSSMIRSELLNLVKDFM